ncbi:Ras-related protein Rab-23 [Phytophthora citrophthora]|uniref:Ras-related protein Rab-23 n=1 Tax=Phytophthora citrophthora TaxID=4793 RepID=A0AAD9GGM8_9STRA|nr:Ras-related protein Rab-23 [Phytophthora citrophthora]
MFDYVARQYRWYKLEFGLTMLSWWEVSIFSKFLRLDPCNCFLLLVTSVTGYYIYSFGNHGREGMEDFDCDDFEKTLKVIVVGNGNVGKTSMTTRYAKGRYTGTYKKTIGVDFMEKTLELRDLGETINLMIWDTAGQEEFDTLTSRYYKGAGAVIYVFSTVDRASFDDLPKWKRKVEEECGQICSVLVQNKIDLEDDAAMTRDEVEDMADYLNMRLYRSCVQDNINVGEVFRYLCRRFLKSGDDGDETVHAVTDISTLSQTAKPTCTSRLKESPEPRTKREISDISDVDSDRTSTAAPSPTAQVHLNRAFPPSPPTVLDREYASDSGDESEKDSPSRGRKKSAVNEERDYDRKQDKRGPGKRGSGNAEADESPHHTLAKDEADLDVDEDAESSETPKLKPSKRRTNGKKTHPPPECVIS